MAKRTKKEVEQGTINIKYAPMNVKGDTAFKCINDDWGVIAFDIRRAQLEDGAIQFGDKELQHNCIYFLIGRDGLTEKVYVGQAKKRNGSGSVLKRLREHANSMTEAYRNIWNRVIVVTGKDDTWGPTELNALEHIFYNTIPAENNLNGNNPNAGIEDLEQFNEKVKQIELYLATLKVGIFSGTDDSEKVTVQSVTNEYSKTEDLQNGMARIPEIVTPQKIVKSMFDLLPADVWNPETTFLDPACKGGEFLKEIYDRLMGAETMKALYPNEFARANHILSKQVFGVSLSEVSKKRTTDTLNGFGYNIKIIDGYISKLKGIGLGSKADGTHRTMQDILNEEFGQVKFDVVIGNPPYNNDLYLDFVQLGHRLSTKYTCMITPAKWQAKGGKKNDDFRKNIVPYMSKIVFYKDSTDIFSIEEWGGISYFIMDSNHHTTKQVANICCKNSSLATGEYPNINYEIHNENPLILYQNKIISILKKCSSTTMLNKSCLFKRFVYTEEQERGYKDRQKDNDALVMQGSKFVGYMPIDELFTLSGLHRYKIVTSCMWGNGNCMFDKAGKLLGVTNMHILKPNEVPKGSFEILRYFDTENECQSFISFMYSKLMAFLIYLGICGATLNAEFWRFVPDPGAFDHIFTDQELYQKYGLTDDEIAIIESVIKERK